MQRRSDRPAGVQPLQAGQRTQRETDAGNAPLTRSVRRRAPERAPGVSNRARAVSRPETGVPSADSSEAPPGPRHAPGAGVRSAPANRAVRDSAERAPVRQDPVHAVRMASRPEYEPEYQRRHEAARPVPGTGTRPASRNDHRARIASDAPYPSAGASQRDPARRASRNGPGFGAMLGIGPRVDASEAYMSEEAPEEAPPRPPRGDGYRRYRQSPPPGRRRRGHNLLGRLLVILLIVALGVGLAGWFSSQYRQRQAREQLQALLSEYPLSYRGLIQRYAAERDLEPCYIAAIIRAESSFQADATSAVNAQGLMQILPDTGEWLAGKFGETYTEGCLYDPETNIRYGCWYIEFLMKRYGGDKACASAAYHSGQGTVDKWLKNPEYSTDGRTLTVIPGDNARTYVERILNYYDIYKQLYGADLSKTPETAQA